MTSLRLALFSLMLLLPAACSPPQQIYMKEKVYYSPPPRAYQTDQFFYKKAQGAVNVLFVVDNTQTGQGLFSAFKQSYVDFIGRMGSDETRLLNYRITVATDYLGHTPKNWVGVDKDPALNLTDLFVGVHDASEDIPPVLNGSENNQGPNPFRAAATGVSVEGAKDRAFESRVQEAIYLVFLTSYEPTVDSSAAEAMYKALSDSKGVNKAHAFSLTRASNPGDHSPAFPHCATLGATPKFSAALKTMPWRSLHQLDLCDPSWITTLPPQLTTSIIEFKKKLILSQTPFEPQTMILRTSVRDRQYRYGDDYQIDGATNEIIFTRDPGLAEGDPLSATYFLEADTRIKPGGSEDGIKKK